LGSSPAIHVNQGLPHQVSFAEALAKGFRRHGLNPVITSNPNQKADWHVCIGPWYAKRHWPECLYIDRAYWGDPESVSVHWLKDGEKIRQNWSGSRSHPELKPIKTGSRTVYLCDYKDRPAGIYDTVRLHPSEKAGQESLSDCLKAHDIAVGRRTTALVQAHIEGLKVRTDDLYSPVWGITDRVQWITNLAWHNWSRDEIEKGEMWSRFK